MMKSADIQQAFADDIRTGGENAFCDDKRMQVYRDLFFNNVRGFIDGAFPVCAEVVGEPQWTMLCREFLRSHYCHTPYFLKISEEFLAFLSVRDDLWKGFPWLAELAHYEWLELAVDVMDVTAPELDVYDADLLADIPVLNPALVAAAYHYPVHTIDKDHPDPQLQSTAVIVYRNASDAVRFVCVNSVAAILCLVLQEGGRSGNDAVREALQRCSVAISDNALAGGTQILRDWLAQGIILGAVKTL